MFSNTVASLHRCFFVPQPDLNRDSKPDWNPKDEWELACQRGRGRVFLAEETASGSQNMAGDGSSRKQRKFGLTELWLICLSPFVFVHYLLLQMVPAFLFLHRNFQSFFFLILFDIYSFVILFINFLFSF